MDALRRRPVAATRELRIATGYSRPSRRAEFDRAMKELQEKFLVLKVEERYDPFTYIWSTLAHQWRDALARGAQAAPRRSRLQHSSTLLSDCRLRHASAQSRDRSESSPSWSAARSAASSAKGRLASHRPPPAAAACYALTEPHLHGLTCRAPVEFNKVYRQTCAPRLTLTLRPIFATISAKFFGELSAEVPVWPERPDRRTARKNSPGESMRRWQRSQNGRSSFWII